MTLLARFLRPSGPTHGSPPCSFQLSLGNMEPLVPDLVNAQQANDMAQLHTWDNQMFLSVEEKVSCNILFTSATCEYASSASPSTRLLCLRAHGRSLQTRLASRFTTSSGKVTPTKGCERIRDPTQKHTYIEKEKLTQADESELEQTHPRVVDPFP
jgi:hypothetical protein